MSMAEVWVSQKLGNEYVYSSFLFDLKAFDVCRARNEIFHYFLFTTSLHASCVS